jgi:hypothetical protein
MKLLLMPKADTLTLPSNNAFAPTATPWQEPRKVMFEHDMF